MADVLKERGLFWWGDEEFDPEREWAPDNSAVGTLTISDNGRIEIELDGVLPSAAGRFAAFSREIIPPDRTIAGKLKSSDQHILAINLLQAGGRFATSNLSFATYIAQTCLVSRSMLPRSPKFRAITVDLSGYEEWSRYGEITHSQTKRNVRFRYAVQPDVRYSSDQGVLTLSRRLDAKQSGQFGSAGLALREIGTLRFRPRRSWDLQDALQAYLTIQDLLILLSGSEYQLDWPTFSLTKGQRCQVYFFVNRSTAEAPSYRQVVASLPAIRECFGDIFSAWYVKRVEGGPGMYLYLATRRGMRMYEEQKFFNLVSGLEALHRSLIGDEPNAGFVAKMTRILADVQSNKDRNWLKKRLRNFGAPSLEQRLFEMLRPLPTDVTDARLRAFCKVCADLRNDLAHRGKPVHAATNSIQYLAPRSAVLSYLYHARLLMEIGLPGGIVDHWLNRGFEAHQINWYMVQAGLKPAPPPPSPPPRLTGS